MGNGSSFQGEGFLDPLNVIVQGHMLLFSAYLLPIDGVEIILGASWLATLGPHIVDYNNLMLQFYSDTRFTTLLGWLTVFSLRNYNSSLQLLVRWAFKRQHNQLQSVVQVLLLHLFH